MSRFEFRSTGLDGLTIARRRPVGDHRGWLERLYCTDEFSDLGFTAPPVQANRTLTYRAGVVRGMHFQRAPWGEDKVVACLRGRVFDVAVDVRKGSSTFLQWHGEILSEDNGLSLLIPRGFAHGFQVLSESSEMLYFHSHRYEPSAEGALHALDPRISIQWPLAVTELSGRDASHPFIEPNFEGLVLEV